MQRITARHCRRSNHCRRHQAPRSCFFTPRVHTVHGWPEMNGIFNVVGDRAWFVAPTKSYASVLPRTPHLEVIHHGIDMTRYPFRDKKEEFVAFVGRATPEKGLHLAISAARRARMRLVAVVTRIGHGWEKQYWDKEVAPLLGGDITIREEVGFDEKVDLLSRARALLFPIAWDEIPTTDDILPAPPLRAVPIIWNGALEPEGKRAWA